MRSYKIENILKNFLGNDIKYTTRDNIAFKYCPFCGNDRYNFEININPQSNKFGYWHCWVCDTGGRKITNIFKRLNYNKNIIEEIQLEIYGEERETEVNIEDLDFIIKEDKTIFIPKWYKRITPKNKFYYNYIIKLRKLHPDVIDLFDIRYYKDKILIPSYNNEFILNGYIIRNLDNDIKKYYIHTNNYKNMIFFENIVDFSLPIILVEGVFDAMTFLQQGIQAIPLLGKKTYANTRLFQNILLKTPEITIFLDRGEIFASKKIAEKFLKYNYSGDIYLVNISSNYKYKDINEMGINNAIELLKQRKKIDLIDLI